MSEKFMAGILPILALRGLTVFPDQTVHFDIGRNKSIKALDVAMKGDQTLFLVPQKDILVDDPSIADLYTIGTVVKVKQVLKNQGDNLRVLVSGVCRGRISEMEQTEPYLSGIVEAVPSGMYREDTRVQALCRDADRKSVV